MEEPPRERQYIDSPMTKQGLTPAETVAYLEQRGARELADDFATVIRLAEEVRALGGRAFVVGGAVRDELLDVLPNDFDLEIHGLSEAEVEEKLAHFGVTKPTGKSFGTYKLPSSIAKTKIELALPRRDSQYGDEHNANKPEIIPGLGLTEAARRREFTVGAIYKDVLTGEIYDPFKGVDDLATKTLRLVDPKTFGDDALRVLRGAGFVARFGLTVEPETKQAMRTMIEKMGALKKERLHDEWKKLLVQGERPSAGIELLRELGVVERWYPELDILWSTPQDTRNHPEKDVGKHSMLVVDEAARLARTELFTEDEVLELMFAALLHDTGKPATTRESGGSIHAYGHEAASIKPAETFLGRLDVRPVRMRRITDLIANHMRPPALYRERENITDRALRKLARDIGSNHLRTIVALAEADHLGRGPFEQADGSLAMPNTSKYRAWWNEQIERLSLDQAPEQILWGRDLVESKRGWSPGKPVGEALALAKELAMQGMTRETVLEIIDSAATPTKAIAELSGRLTPEE